MSRVGHILNHLQPRIASAETEQKLEHVALQTVEMHTGGEPLRIVRSGYPDVKGATILAKRRYAKEELDYLRKLIIFEPRGHFDMYGVILVKPDLPTADIAVLFMHNEGYSTMCGHAVISLGRYAVDYGFVTPKSPETQVNIQCPCGLVKTYVEYKNGKSGAVRFHSVPAFAFGLDIVVPTEQYGDITLDIGYGGAYYALADAAQVGLDVSKSPTRDLVEAATIISEATRKAVTLTHPEDVELSFLYGTILTDGKDAYPDEPTANMCVFADREVDRCPTGSGVTARIAVQYAKHLVKMNQKREFVSGANGSVFTGMAVAETKAGDFDAVVVEVAGKGFYSGEAKFTYEKGDSLGRGFLLS